MSDKYKTYEELKEELGNNYDLFMYEINLCLLQKIDKAIEYNEHLIRDAKYHLNLGHLKKMKKILLGDKENE